MIKKISVLFLNCTTKCKYVIGSYSCNFLLQTSISLLIQLCIKYTLKVIYLARREHDNQNTLRL